MYFKEIFITGGMEYKELKVNLELVVFTKV